ncbi:cysteate racemase [Bacillus tuaregi]|uniref:aspartate/glutamate racemase family protein n=1 Tax=Bacillus tuaregi TaxID=1816695 RepID=UPI0008F8DF77|nr:amino acid racemase [Bacillus tuaregi]
MSNTIGILGGMGPYATIDLFEKIVKHTPAQKDQEHLQILIYNNPKIPPRVEAENHSFHSPLAELIKSARLLEHAGADFIIMPCHTAHIWIQEIRKAITIPFYSLIENTVEATKRQYENESRQRILLLATSTTIQAGLYQEAFKASTSTFDIIVPQQGEQRVVDRAIMDVKAGKLENSLSIQELDKIIHFYYSNGASFVLGGCTEVPLMFPYFETNMSLIDPTLMLAIMAIQKAL